MPKAPVDEHGDVCASEDDVGCTTYVRERADGHSISEALSMQTAPNGEFG